MKEMSDRDLATFQAGNQERTANSILADQEWKRRLIREEFNLHKQLADADRKWLMISAFIGVVGTIVGAIVGAWITTSAEQKSNQSLSPRSNIQLTTQPKTDASKALPPEQKGATKQ
jgi:hypothetical protein